RNTWRPLAARSVAEALHNPLGPGPVHLNLAFRDPLTGEPGPLPDHTDHAAAPRPAAKPETPTIDRPLDGRGLIIAGAHATKDPSRLVELGEAMGWPVLADPRSGCRVPGTIAAADAIIRADVPVAETVLMLGTPWLSKALSEYVSRAAHAGGRIVAVDPWQKIDPTRVVTEFHQVEQDAFLASARSGALPADPEWLAL